MTTVDFYCLDPDHAAREGEEGWTDASLATLTFEGEAPPDVASRYVCRCDACARATAPLEEVPDAG